ncbi:hypothetical protein [Pedobacter sp. NJ-S-72]
MFMKNVFKTLCLSLFILGNSQLVTAQQTTVILRADKPSGQISKHIYGHFAEHLGRCIYDGFYVGENSKIPNTEG